MTINSMHKEKTAMDLFFLMSFPTEAHRPRGRDRRESGLNVD
jgi:hypothetical protein